MITIWRIQLILPRHHQREEYFNHDLISGPKGFTVATESEVHFKKEYEHERERSTREYKK